MRCKWCGADDISPGHTCAGMPPDIKHELTDYAGGVTSAAGASGLYYVMMEPTRNFAGPFVRLILAKAGETLVNDQIIDRQEIKISEGGWGHLNSKYGDLGRLEYFDDPDEAQARHSMYLKQVTVYARRR